jgi:hypothetical protein
LSDGVKDREGARGAEGALSKGGLRDGIDGTAAGAGVYDGEGMGAGLEKPDRESLGFAPPVADLGRGLSARDGREFEGICQPPSLAWSTCIPAIISYVRP